MNVDLGRRVALVMVGVLCLPGCSGSGLETIPVYGNVEFAGRETPEICRVFFHPVETAGPMRPCGTNVEEDGSYTVNAFKGSNGLLPGTYQIRVSCVDLKPGSDPNMETSWIQQAYDAGELVVESGSSGVERHIEVPSE